MGRIHKYIVTIAILASALVSAGAMESSDNDIPDCRRCTTTIAPVRGSNGVQYPNECIARCQGISMQSSTPAGIMERFMAASASAINSLFGRNGLGGSCMHAPDWKSKWQDLYHMFEHGYTFHGQHEGVADAPVDMPEDFTPGTADSKTAALGVAITYPDNSVYVQTKPHKYKWNKDDENEDLGGNAGVQHARKLKTIIGKNDRVQSWGDTLSNRATIQISHHKKWGIGYFAQESFEFYERVDKDEKAEKLPIKAIKVVTPRGWVEDRDSAYDIALIYVDQPIGEELGYFSTAYNCKKEKYEMYILGYPSEYKELGLRYRSQCTVVPEKPCAHHLIHHTCDTTPGESGAPMFTKDNVIHAVHSYGLSKRYNGAVMLRPDIYGLIQAARESTISKKKKTVKRI